MHSSDTTLTYIIQIIFKHGLFIFIFFVKLLIECFLRQKHNEKVMGQLQLTVSITAIKPRQLKNDCTVLDILYIYSWITSIIACVANIPVQVFHILAHVNRSKGKTRMKGRGVPSSPHPSPVSYFLLLPQFSSLHLVINYAMTVCNLWKFNHLNAF